MKEYFDTKDNSSYFEWVQVSENQVVIANSDYTWLGKKESIKNFSCSPKKINQNNSATTKNLLDGTIAAAKITCSSDNKKPPTLTPSRWVWQLAGAYHTCAITPKVMREVSQRFAELGQSNLAEWANRKAQEEQDHDKLALLDIKSLGYDAKKIVEAIDHPGATALIEYFKRSLDTNNSNLLNSVGYLHALERISLAVEEEHIQEVESILPSVNATRCFREHSSLGNDPAHVKDNIQTISKLSPTERSSVAKACYETAKICFSSPKEYISEEKLQNLLEPFKLKSNIKTPSKV